MTTLVPVPTADPPSPESATARDAARSTLRGLGQIAARAAALAVIFVAFGLYIPRGVFFSPGNIENIAMQSAVYALCGLGMTMVIITGGIDWPPGRSSRCRWSSPRWCFAAERMPRLRASPPDEPCWP